MTTWRVTVVHRDGSLHDALIDGDEESTFAEALSELSRHRFEDRGLLVDGRPVSPSTRLWDSPLRNGSVLSHQPPADGASLTEGWYLVAVAGPDTGAFAPIGDRPVVVGRSASNDVMVGDAAMSSPHLSVAVEAGSVIVQDLNSRNGTTVEQSLIAGPTAVRDGTYIHAGSTTFAVIHLSREQIPALVDSGGPAHAFQRRFRELLPKLPDNLKHPAEPSKPSSSYKRPLVSFMIPIISAVGMAVLTGRYIFLAVVALGPIFFAVDGVRRRKATAREERESEEAYEAQRRQFLSELQAAREEELARDRWVAAPAGLSVLLARAGHTRLWERSANDLDFVSVAVGLWDRPSDVSVQQRPDNTPLPMDTQWSAVLRHSLVREGSLAIVGPLSRCRSVGRALMLDLATSHSPNDVKLWLLTTSAQEHEWNAVRWLPHAYLGSSQGRVFSTPAARSAALSSLKGVISDRLAVVGREPRVQLPVHVVVIDCVDELDTATLTDLLSDGARVGVIGVSLDASIVPEGCRGQLTLGQFADQARFVSDSQPSSDNVRAFEMSTAVFDPAARAMARLRPSGSARDEASGAELVRLVELIDAPLSNEAVPSVLDRWLERGRTARVRVGGLRDTVMEIDLMRDGPHGFVAGATRSGKTEFLKALITSLAVANHPDDFSIVIVDFKGGVDHELSARLPHVIDLSTNHNLESFLRTVQLIEAELDRRQREFRAAGVPNFDAYQNARTRDATLKPIPRLLIIIDEFSQLAKSAEGKDSLSALQSVTAVGGGLGVHLLLVTQTFEVALPAQITGNAGLRVCFRVQKPEYSNTVIDAPDAALIPNEHVGRALLRSKGGPIREFQAARIAGPTAGYDVGSSTVEVRRVPFGTISDSPPEAVSGDVPAEHTEMWAVVEVLRAAAAASGWTEPAIPWPKTLAPHLTIRDVNAGAPASMVWPVGLLDEPEFQRQVVTPFDPYGPHILFAGSRSAELAEVIRGVVVSGALRRTAADLHVYVIDQLGQGLSALGSLPHVGGVAERNEPLALRILRHVATEVGRRKSRFASVGATDVREYRAMTGESIPETLLVLHGCDRFLMHGEGQQSPLLAPILGLLAESAGTGVRVLMTGPPAIAHHRLGSAAARRYVFELSDPQEYGALNVPKGTAGAIAGLGRAVDTSNGHLMQFALVPTRDDTSPAEVIRAIGQRLYEHSAVDERLSPVQLRELVWPLPLKAVLRETPPAGVLSPVALAVDADTGGVSWLDAVEDGPAFVVCGPSRSGRSTALLSAAHLMAAQGWKTFGATLSRRSPLAAGVFGGQLIDVPGIAGLADAAEPCALFIDDVHKWQGAAESLKAFQDGPGDRALILAGPTEFFAGRNEVIKVINMRCALVLAPKGGMDAATFGIRRLADEVLRDNRPGRGVLVVAGELINAQVPLTEW